jgi:hypothetical protein
VRLSSPVQCPWFYLELQVCCEVVLEFAGACEVVHLLFPMSGSAILNVNSVLEIEIVPP